MEIAIWVVIGFGSMGVCLFMYYTIKREAAIERDINNGRTVHNRLNKRVGELEMAAAKAWLNISQTSTGTSGGPPSEMVCKHGYLKAEFRKPDDSGCYECVYDFTEEGGG